jgi:hypothetical protein
MSPHSRGYTATALLAALMAIPAMAQAQTGAAEKSLMNRVTRDVRGPVAEHQAVAIRGDGDRSQGARALLGTVGAVQFGERDGGAADSGAPSPEQALLGRVARGKTGE